MLTIIKYKGITPEEFDEVAKVKKGVLENQKEARVKRIKKMKKNKEKIQYDRKELKKKEKDIKLPKIR